MSHTTSVGIGDKKFVVGLNWRPLDGKPKQSTLKSYSNAYGDWGVVRKTSAGTWQVGFGKTIENAKASSFLSLAAMVAETKEAPWRGIFKLSEDVYWYVAVRDNNEIIPNGDMVGTLDDILTVKNDQVNYGGWNEDIENGSVDDLVTLIVGQKSNKLKDFSSTNYNNYIISAVVIALAAGGLYYKHYKDLKEQQRLALIAKQKREAQLLALKKGGAILPWANLPSPSIFLNSCHQVFENTPISKNGWSLENWTCEYKGEGEKVKENQYIKVVYGWDRSYGLANDAPGPLLGGDEKSSSTEKVNVSRVLGIKQKPMGYNDAVRNLWTISEKLNIRLTLGDKKPGQVSLPGMASAKSKNEDTASPWKTEEFTMDMDFSPFMDGFVGYLQSNPVIYVSSVRWEKSKWVLEGKLYAKK